MADVSRDTLQLLILPDPRLSTPDAVWAAQSSYTEANPRAGQPSTTDETSLRLHSSGAQSVATVEVLATRGGLPGPGPDKAAIVHRVATSGDYYGWDVPVTSLGWEAVHWCTGAGTGVIACYSPHAVTLPDGEVLCAFHAEWVVGMTTYYRVACAIRSPSAATWSTVSVHSSTDIPTDGYHPCLLVLPSGRVLCFYWLYDDTNDLAQIQMSYSDDSGATWTRGQRFVLPDGIDISGAAGAGSAGYECGRIRAAYRAGEISLVAHLIANDTTPTYRDTFAQYVSEDLGCAFSTVDATWDTASDGGAKHEVIATETQFVLLYISDVDLLPHARRIGSGYDTYAAAEEEDVAPSTEVWATQDGGSQYIADGDLCACLDEDGAIYVYGRQPSVLNQGIVARSPDWGETWDGMGHSPYTCGLSSWWYGTDASTHPRGLTATCQRGRVVLLHDWDADPGDEDNSLGALYLGGYTTITMPGYLEFDTDLDRVAYTVTWLPLDEPGDCGWTAAGAGTDTLTAGALNVVTAANSRYYYRNPSGTTAEGIIARFAFAVVSGGQLGSGDIETTLRCADGTHDWEVQIRFTTTGFRVYDVNGAAAIGADVVVSTTGGIEVIAALNDGHFRCWYRIRSTSELHAWTAGPTSDAVTDDAVTPNANHLIEWGHFFASNAETNWYEAHYVSDEWAGWGLADGFTNPTDLFGRNVSLTPCWIGGSVRLWGDGGACVSGDAWTLTRDADYSLSRIFPSVQPSSLVGWRSVGSNAEVIALHYDDTLLGTDSSKAGNDIVGFAFYGINWPSVVIAGYNAITSAWVNLGTAEATEGCANLRWTRRGNTVFPTGTDAGDQPYLHFNEMAGGSFVFDGGAVRKILWNTEGRFGSGTGKKATLVLDGIVGTEGASGTAGSIRSPRLVAIVKLDGSNYAGFRFTIGAGTSCDGYWKIGTLIAGPCAVFGWIYDWGRSILTEANVQVTRAPDGSSRSLRLGPPRRTVELNWTSGVDTTGGYSGLPDYLYGSAGGGAEPVASSRDTPFMLAGSLSMIDGYGGLVVYCPYVAKTGTVIELNRWGHSVYGRVVGGVSLETMLGEEWSTEVLTVPNFTIEEEP